MVRAVDVSRSDLGRGDVILRLHRSAGPIDGDRRIRGRLAGIVSCRRVDGRGRCGVGSRDPDSGGLDLDGLRPLRIILPVFRLVLRRAPRCRLGLWRGHFRRCRRCVVDGLIGRLVLDRKRRLAEVVGGTGLPARPARLRTGRGGPSDLGHRAARTARTPRPTAADGSVVATLAPAARQAPDPNVTAGGRLIDGRSDADRSRHCRHR